MSIYVFIVGVGERIARELRDTLSCPVLNVRGLADFERLPAECLTTGILEKIPVPPCPPREGQTKTRPNRLPSSYG